ncbi:MAG: hypothetical protein V4449_03430 [Patescibacteria group bacterium]
MTEVVGSGFLKTDRLARFARARALAKERRERAHGFIQGTRIESGDVLYVRHIVDRTNTIKETKGVCRVSYGRSGAFHGIVIDEFPIPLQTIRTIAILDRKVK